METLEDEIFFLEPTIDLLHECLGIGMYEEIVVTSDGFFLGRLNGDCGFNHFLGLPSKSAMARTKNLYEKLSAEHQLQVIRLLHARAIPPEAIGIPEKRD